MPAIAATEFSKRAPATGRVFVFAPSRAVIPGCAKREPGISLCTNLGIPGLRYWRSASRNDSSR